MAKTLPYILILLFCSYLCQAEKLPVVKPSLSSGLLTLIESLKVDSTLQGELRIEAPNSKRMYSDQNKQGVAWPDFWENSSAINDNPLDILDNMDDLVNSFTEEEATNFDKARAALLAVQESANFVQAFDGSSIKNLPVGLNQEFGETNVRIVLNAIRIYPTHTALEVFVEVKRPDWPSPLMFYSPDIRFSQSGGLTGLSSVGLMGNFVIPVEEGKTILMLKRGVYDPVSKEFIGGTYLNFGCSGFQKMGISASVHFSKEWLLPVLPNGRIDTTNRVVANFDIEVEENVNNIIAEISLGEFVVPQVDRVAWTVESAVFDFSETEKRFEFPLMDGNYDPTINGEGYLANTEEWKGVFIEQFGIKWIDTLAMNTQTSVPEINGYELVIDHNGFSGFVEVLGLLPIEQGNIDGWDISLDRLGVGVIMNQPVRFEFEGVLVVPLLKSEDSGTSDRLSYSGLFDFEERKYAIAAGLAEDKEFDMKIFKGKAVIYEDTKLILQYYQEVGFSLEAIIHGRFEIPNITLAGKKLNLPSVQFQNVHIASAKDYIRSIGVWDLPDSVGCSFMGFGFNTEVLKIVGEGDEAELQVVADINFGSSGGIYVSAGGAFRLQGEVVVEGGQQRQNYKFNKIVVDMLRVEAELTAVAFSGYIIFFRDDPLWGTGFQGKLEVFIKGLNKEDEGEANMGLAALALFGTAEGDQGSYRYFLVDMMARLGVGIPIPSTGVSLKGVGGGIYYRMNQLSVSQNIQDEEFSPGDPESQPDAYRDWMLQEVGKSLSGTQYVPDDGVSFGINTTVVIALEEEETFNANITFTLQLNDNYGIQFIRLKGVGNFMSPISWTAPSCSGVSVAVEMDFVFDSPTGEPPGFYANCHIFINIEAGPQRVLYGIASNPPPTYYDAMAKVCDVNDINYAGGMEFQLTKDDWFVNLGRPDARISASAGFGPARADFRQYIDIGTNIPSPPPLPANVAHLTQFDNLNEAGRATGNGFAFGASFDISLIDYSYLIFTAQIGMQAGFDVFVKQYDPVYCQGGEPLGENFFYAMGQAYAYIGANIQAFGFNIIQASLAAAIQFKGPKPFFGKGAVAGEYTVGPFGMYTRSCHFVFEFGEECQTDDAIETSYDLIADILPSEAAVNVSLDENVFAAFNYPLDQDYLDTDADGNVVRLRMHVDQVQFTAENGDEVAAEITEQGYFLTVVPQDMLDPYSDYTFSISVSFRDENENSIQQENMTRTFTTGVGLKVIPPSNIEYAYPADGQYNFYSEAPAESTRIQLKKGQPDLFDSDLYNVFGKLTSSFPAYDAQLIMIYKDEEDLIRFNLPDDLIPGQMYRLQIVSQDILSESQNQTAEGGGSSDDSTDTNNNNNSNSNNNAPLGMDIPLGGVQNGTNPNFPGGDELPEPDADERVIYEQYFRKSLYDNPQEKYNNLLFSQMNGTEFDVEEIAEPFGREELFGLYQDPPSIRFVAKYEETDWYDSYANFSTENGTIEPYVPNSGRTDYDVAIKDDLRSHRVKLYGPSTPSTAIITDTESTPALLAEAHVLQANNVANQQGLLAVEPEITMVYAMEQVVWNDISYYINRRLMGFGFEEILTPIQQQIEEGNYNCANLNDCCKTNDAIYGQLRTAYEERLSESDHIFKGSYFINENRNQACKNLIPATIEDNGPYFIKHSLLRNPLSTGEYPVFMYYEYPRNATRLHSDVYMINRPQAANQ